MKGCPPVAFWPDPPEVAEAPAAFLERVGEVFAVFDERTQDSGNVSYGVRVGARAFLTKSPGLPDTRSSISFEERVRLLRNAAALARSVESPLLPHLHVVLEGPAGPLLIYDWVDGELLYDEAAVRERPESARSRFRRLPAPAAARTIGDVFELHAQLASRGWVAGDFYDGCLIYDFSVDALHVVDLDQYYRGPFTNPVGRLPGSTRFMAPEEFRPGARIDARTTVFNLGRLAFELMGDGRRERASFRGTDGEFEAAFRATAPDPADRFPGPAELLVAWRGA